MRYIMYKFGELPSNNLGVYGVKMHKFCRDLDTIWQSIIVRHLGVPKWIEMS